MTPAFDSVSPERLHQSVILIVDDVDMNCKMLSHSLLARGYTHIATAENGSVALQMTQDMRPDLVILDLMMPGMDGFSYCQAIRQDKSFDGMPIIVQTALNDMEKKLKAFDLGASDYICKPIDPGELRARIEVHLSQKILLEDLRAYHTRMTAELNSARHMQNRLMPGAQQVQMCERVFDMKIAQHFETSSVLGGDCWGMRPLSDSKLALFMYDFSGHGMSAAMNVFRMHTIMQEFLHTGGEPGNFLSTLNRHLHSLLERDEFATMFYGVTDIDANCLLYASAAVPPAFVFNKTSASPVMLAGRGFPLGVVSNATYETKYTPFTQGDLLLLFSDCLIETKNPAGEFLNETAIGKAVQEEFMKESKNPAQQSIDTLVKIFRQHSSAPLKDDLTMNAYWRCPKG